MKESSILVLDEPTASMDALAELEIFQTFDKLKKNNCLYLQHIDCQILVRWIKLQF